MSPVFQVKRGFERRYEMKATKAERERGRGTVAILNAKLAEFYIFLSSCELILTWRETARSRDTVSALETPGNKRVIGSGIKGLIHYLFSYGHFRYVPSLCVFMCIYVGACSPLISNSPLYVAKCSSWQRESTTENQVVCKHQSSNRLFPSRGLTRHPGAMITIFQKDLHLIIQMKN